jgi:hypothetical protein
MSKTEAEKKQALNDLFFEAGAWLHDVRSLSKSVYTNGFKPMCNS